MQTEEAPGVPKELECSLPGISSFWKGVTPELGNRVQEAHNVDNVTFSHPVETGGWGWIPAPRAFFALCSSRLGPAQVEVPETRVVVALVAGGRVGVITRRSAGELSPLGGGWRLHSSPGCLSQGCCRSSCSGSSCRRQGLLWSGLAGGEGMGS